MVLMCVCACTSRIGGGEWGDDVEPQLKTLKRVNGWEGSYLR